MPSGRTTLPKIFSSIIQHVVPKLEKTTIPFSTATRVKSWRFRALRHRQSALAFVVKRILCECDMKSQCKCNMHRFYQDSKKHKASNDMAVVAYGGAKFNPSMCGNAPAPNSRIGRGLERLAHVKVVFTDEFRTSKLCSVCHHELVPFKHSKAKESNNISTINTNPPTQANTNLPYSPYGYHAVLQCSNSKCHAHEKPWKRDVNAAINIASVFLFSLSSPPLNIFDRPPPFQRGSKITPNPSSPPSFDWFRKFNLTSPSSL